MGIDIPVIWFVIIVFATLMYIVMDGFDLGIGMVFSFVPNASERDVMMNSVAPASNTMRISPKIRMRRVISNRCCTTSCPYLADSTPLKFSIASAAVLTRSGCITVTSKEFGRGF